MRLNKREKWLAIVAAAALVIIGSDRLLLGPILHAYGELDRRQAQALTHLQQARRLTQDRRTSTRRWEQMQTLGVLNDPSQAENQLLHAVRTWSRQAGVNLVSLQPERASSVGELREITFAANGSGTMQAVVRFLDLIQQSPQPVRVRRLRLAGVDSRETLTIEMRLSTIYHHLPETDRPLLPMRSAQPPQPTAETTNSSARGGLPAHAAARLLVVSAMTAADDDNGRPTAAPSPAAPPAQQSPQPPHAPRDRLDPRYQVIIDRNIFAKNRTPPTAAEAKTPPSAPTSSPRDDTPPAPAPADPGSYFVLRGISHVGDQAWAFFEDLRDGRYHRLLPGQTLGGRLIQSMTFSQVMVEHDDQVAAVVVGHSLTGQPPATAAAQTDRHPAATTTTTATVGDTDETALSVIERLRRRRQQEITP